MSSQARSCFDNIFLVRRRGEWWTVDAREGGRGLASNFNQLGDTEALMDTTSHHHHPQRGQIATPAVTSITVPIFSNPRGLYFSRRN